MNRLFVPILGLSVILSFNIPSMGLTVIGGDSSGGGPGIFCPKSVRGQPRVQTLDIFEGRAGVLRLDIPESAEPLDTQLERVVQRFAFDFGLRDDVAAALTQIQKQSLFLPSGVSIHVPPDLGANDAVLVPTGCFIGGIGYYQMDGTLLVSSDAYSNLSTTQKAAFWTHEAIYQIVRKFNRSSNSKSTREIVASIFSRNPDLNHLWLVTTPASSRFRGISPHFTWHAGKEFENKILNFGQVASVKDLLSGKKIEVITELDISAPTIPAPPDFPPMKNPMINCMSRQNSIGDMAMGGLSQQKKKLDYYIEGGTTASGNIPDDCEVIAINMNRPYGPPMAFEIKYDGKVLFSGQHTSGGEKTIYIVRY